jgi:hypothetical protein
MVSPVSPPQARAYPEVQPPAVRPPAKPQPAATETVKISVAAQALQEAAETQAQTTKEAGSGDVQARRLLAQEAASGAVTKLIHRGYPSKVIHRKYVWIIERWGGAGTPGRLWDSTSRAARLFCQHAFPDAV